MTDRATRSIDAARYALSLAWRAAPMQLLALATLTVIAACLPVSTLWLIWRLVDAVVMGTVSASIPEDAVVLALLLAAATSMQFFLGVLQDGMRERFGYKVALAAERSLLDYASRVSLPAFDDDVWYDRFSRTAEDIDWRPVQIAHGLTRLLSTATGLVGTSALLATLEPTLVGLALAASAPLVIAGRRSNRAMFRTWRETTVLTRRRAYLRDVLSRPEHAKEVRSYELGRPFLDEHTTVGDRLITSVAAAHRGNGRRAAWASLVNGACLASAYLLLANGAARGSVSAADLFLLFSAFGAVSSGVLALCSVLVDLEENATYLADHKETVSSPVEDLAPRSPERSSADASGGLELHAASYTYPDGTSALREVSFSARPGDFVAIVGQNGAGKSTLVKLAVGLLRPDSGHITWNGTSIDELGVGALRAATAALFQEHGRYECTIEESVALGRAGPTDPPAIADALITSSAVYAFDLRDGLQTRVGRLFRDAHDLSGGQWQRLALARCLYRGGDLVVLDEPTTALDPEVEWEVLEQLRCRLRNKVVLLITHRMAAAARADRIVVLNAGAIVEQGSHDDLLSLGGQYASLYRRQADAFDRSQIVVAAGHSDGPAS